MGGHDLMKSGPVLRLPAQKNACVEKPYPLYKILWLGLCEISMTLHFPPLHLYQIIPPSLSGQSHDPCRGAANAVLPLCYVNNGSSLYVNFNVRP